MHVTAHILTHEGTKFKFLDEAAASVKGEPDVKILYYHDAFGYIGAARADCFRQSETEYVTYVDSDDRVLPGAIAACVEALEANKDAAFAFTLEERIDGLGNRILGPRTPEELQQCLKISGFKRFCFKTAHHLTVYRREAILPYLAEMEKFHIMAEQVLNANLLVNNTAVFVDRIGYQWRQHDGQTTKQANTESRNDAVNYLCKILPLLG